MKFFNQFLVYALYSTVLVVQVFASPINILEKRAYATLQKGSKGNDVKKLQNKLISLGYSCGPSGADGDYGAHTVFCVYAFQQVNGLSTDGVAGSQTQTKLYGTSAARNNVNGDETTSTVVATLSIGSKGDKVKRVQTRLILLGYNCGSSKVDGDYGNNTVNCVKAFQKNNGITQSGSIDTTTHKKLFSKNAINVKNMASSSLTRFVNTALEEFTYSAKLSNNNRFSKFGAWFGINPGNWCAMFVSWVASENKSVASHIIEKSASVATLKNNFVNKGRFGAKSSYSPKYGDIMFLTNNASHVAIVVGVSGSYVYTIEGNYSNMVKVVKRSINDSQISGYGKNNSNNIGYPINI